ncbi:natural killer cells antigen CD94 isoform X2 [Mustela lutreola]|uniref:natural killer cells antigen CD94 isoform X2 n=1 Tax=Mustela lutreola TaxID=9666 RepID=UPI002797790A|nr:natural killer cells antigen CD94 isoform X2 [Mustela lutreola]
MAASQTTPWNLISGILGVTCLILMATMGILLKNLYPKQSIPPTLSPDEITEVQKGWIGYQCNCYFFSRELKTWQESQRFCAFLNSSLLWFQNRDKLHFMSSSTYFYWIGLLYHKDKKAWLWEDGSPVSQDLLPSLQKLNTKKCIMYSSSQGILDERCDDESRFICKKELI